MNSFAYFIGILIVPVVSSGIGYLCLFLGRRSNNPEHPNGALGYRVSSFIFFCLALQGVGFFVGSLIFPAYNSGSLGLAIVLMYSTIRAKDNNWKTWPGIGFLALFSIAIYLMPDFFS